MKHVSRWRRAVSGGVAAALLSACGGAQSGVYPASPGQSNVPAHVPAQQGCPLVRCIVVGTAVPKRNGTWDGSILFFPRNANGNARPVAKIEGSLTGLHYTSSVAMDSKGNIYAANYGSNSVTVFAAGSEGNVAPIRSIAGTQTELRRPTGIALDADDDLLVANSAGKSVTVYAPNSNGNVRPRRVISGNKTMLDYPWGIALDSSWHIYVTNGDSVTVYAANAKGNATPQRQIFGSLTQLDEPEGIAVDASGYTYVVNWDAYTFVVFAPGANGNEPPAREDLSGLYGPNGVAVDADGRTYVVNGCQDNASFVAVYVAGANRTALSSSMPLRIIEGGKTKLGFCSTSILVR